MNDSDGVISVINRRAPTRIARSRVRRMTGYFTTNKKHFAVMTVLVIKRPLATRGIIELVNYNALGIRTIYGPPKLLITQCIFIDFAYKLYSL